MFIDILNSFERLNIFVHKKKSFALNQTDSLVFENDRLILVEYFGTRTCNRIDASSSLFYSIGRNNVLFEKMVKIFSRALRGKN